MKLCSGENTFVQLVKRHITKFWVHKTNATCGASLNEECSFPLALSFRPKYSVILHILPATLIHPTTD